MGLKTGALLWNRQRLTLAPGFTTVNTGLAQPNRSFPDYSPNEPRISQFTSGLATIGSRIQVIPQAPMAAWTNINHGEPFLDTDGLIKVVFNNLSGGPLTFNVLFWDPHSIVGPGDADTYSP